MGQFKPMVKMFTDEPSVILKLKKGGKVKSKAAGQDEGFQSMAHNTTKMYESAEEGVAPKKPSMADRRKAMKAAPAKAAKATSGRMATSLMKDGGKTSDKKDDVKHMRIGGFLRSTPVPARSMGNPARVVSQYNPMPAQVHPMVAAGQAPAPQRFIPYSGLRYSRRFAEGGETGATRKAEMSKMKGLEKELKSHESKPASKAHKGLKTGGVAMGQGGYKKGGNVGMGEGVPKSGIIKTEGQGGKFRNTAMNTAKANHSPAKTGDVKLGNGGGYKHGGKAMKYASGGAIDAKLTRTTVEGGNWENRPANTSKPGVNNTRTGEVKKANAGGYKKGGATKKAYATGGNVVDDGKAQKMPRHAVSRPVANTLQSGTFKRGGKVGKFAEGNAVEDMSKGAYDRSIGPSKEDMDMAKSIRSIPSKIYQGAKSLLGGMTGAEKAPGAVTKTKESVTVAPAKKRGGLAKC